MLDIISVSKLYGSKKALDDVNISFKKGETTALLGHNGAGKSSLLRIILQLNTASSGDILYQKDLLTTSDIRSFGYLPEERGLYKNMKVGEQLIYFGQLKGLTQQVAKDNSRIWLEKFKITETENHLLSALSKGMQQKVQFISSVIHNPDFIILDEPFSGLDPVNASLFIEQIKNLKKEGKTIIFSSHQMNYIEDLCDKIVLLNNGKKILDGTLKEIQSKYSSEEYIVQTTKPISKGKSYEITSTSKEGTSIKILSSQKEAIAEINDNHEIINFHKNEISLTEIFVNTFNLNS